MDKFTGLRTLAFIVLAMCQQSVWSQPTADQLNPTTDVREVFFGYDVAFFGEMLLVAVPGDPKKAPSYGVVQVYERQGGSWVRVDSLRPKSPVESAFGWQLEVIGEELLVLSGVGVYVFTYQDGEWHEQQLLSIPSGFRYVKVAANADHLLLGGLRSVEGSNFREGVVSAFRRDRTAENEWSPVQQLQPSPGVGDAFGADICVARNELFVGAGRDPVIGRHSGSAYVFKFENGLWSQSQKLLPSELEEGSQFGRDLVCDDSRLLIGSYSAGGILEFRRDDEGDWVEYGTIVIPGQSRFSKLHLLDGWLFGVGSIEETDGARTKYASPLFLLTKEGSHWQLKDTIRTPHPMEEWERDEGQFGEGVALNSQYLAVGAPYRDQVGRDETGEVHIFDRSSVATSSERPPVAYDPTKFAVFPNPSATSVSVVTPGGVGDIFQLTLFDAVGRVIRSFENGSDGPFDVGQLQPGVYFLRGCTDRSGCSTQPLTVVK